MSVIVELTYDMSKLLGEARIDVEAADVPSAIAAVRDRFVRGEGDFDALRSRVVVAVNGVLVRHRDEEGTRLKSGDRMSFVKAASGG
jgi:molybdopterin converting factor small subunit